MLPQPSVAVLVRLTQHGTLLCDPAIHPHVLREQCLMDPSEVPFLSP